MERSMIIKALEWCIQSESCEYCDYNAQKIDVCPIRSDALALIISQDQRIKELAEKAQTYKEHHDIMDVECSRLEKRNDELTEENERLRLAFGAECDLSNCPRKKEIIADTVREMQERFKELMGGEFASCGFCNAEGYWSVKAVKDNIDRIANEILNENTEE